MVLKLAIGQPRVNILPPVWVAVLNRETAKQHLLPVCECPGHMHRLSTVAGADDTELQFDAADLNDAEEVYLELCEAAEQCRDPSISLPDKYPSVAKLAERMERAFRALQLSKKLKPLWHPTSVAPLWVCNEHFNSMAAVESE